MNRTISIPANGAPVAVPLGPFKYLAIRSAGVAFQISFDGWNWQSSRQNDLFDKSKDSSPPEKVYFMAAGGLAASVVIDWDMNQIRAQDTAQSVVLNSALGTGGAKNAITVNTAKTAANADYAYGGAAAVDLTKNNLLYIPGTRNGKKRKEITFDNRSSANDVIVFAPDGSICFRIAPGDPPRTLETSSDFYLGGNGNPCVNFIFNELYYEQSNS